MYQNARRRLVFQKEKDRKKGLQQLIYDQKNTEDEKKFIALL